MLGIYADRIAGGVSAVSVESDGVRVGEIGEAGFAAYRPEAQAVIAEAIADGGAASACAAGRVVEDIAAGLVDRLGGAEMIGFHGETLHHQPLRRETRQAGDGQMLADAAGLPVVWDFRDADMTMGGAGRPLLPVFLHALMNGQGATCVFDFGRVMTLMFVDPGKDPAEPGALLAFDAAPGLARLQTAPDSRTEQAVASFGSALKFPDWDDAVVENLCDAAYAMKIPPKVLDRDDFPQLSVAQIGVGSACAAIAVSAAGAAQHLPAIPARFFLSGAGAAIPGFDRLLSAALGEPVESLDAICAPLALRPAMVAYLAARVSAGLPTTYPATTGIAAPTGGGVISFPRG